MGESSVGADGGFGHALAKAMERRGLTTFDVAESAGVEVTDVRRCLADEHFTEDDEAPQRVRAWLAAET